MQLPTRSQVLKTLFEKWTPTVSAEVIPTDEALGRVLTHDYHALYSIPVVRASAMDGVAVISSRFASGIPDTKLWVNGVDYCRADTGDDFDDRFDAVIPIERVSITESGLWINPDITVQKNMNIRPHGSTISKGTLVGKAGQKLCSFDLACLAMGGVTDVEVHKKPRIAFLPTGSELVPLGAEVLRGKNIDSNSVFAKNILLEMGAEPVVYPIVKDIREKLEVTLNQALSEADVVILSGGSSKGEEDFNARILEDRGVALFHWVAAAPGKPMCVAVIDNKPVINIPGPPVAMLYGMDWCIRAIVHRMLHIPMPKRQTITGVLTEEIKAPPSMEILCLMDVENGPDGYLVKQKPWKGGSMANSLAAGAFYITELGVETKHPGEPLEVTLLRGEEYFV
ncbi:MULTISPECIES: molybdopterin molybdotransferase MoeA [unclassified Sedimentibacter]|uniref:molybdopterin molybdotransferase MoeA n=1 Tax=unclassified Sedimentibacter TaxID=2649220 RepID=UPI0027DFF500|nr:molybdopterin molybdotransferase MoeA [Sedimentibacter sp. MB35-C1]WMJ78051.1 molybdopterin molybdotransferase MoeA [Sedimentibacter sp. MB35-C1]